MNTSTRRRSRRSVAGASALVGALALPLAGTAAAGDGLEPLLRRLPAAAAAPESAESSAGFAQRPQGRAVQAAGDTPPQIVYSVSNQDDASAVVRLNPLTGRVRTVVAAGNPSLSAASWSSRDGRISYSRGVGRRSSQVDSIPQAGGRSRLEVRDAESADVSPDGRRVVFAREEYDGPNLFVADRDGTRVRRLTGAGGSDPRFSPDGTRVVFSREVGGNSQSDLFTIRTDGTGLRRVTATAEVEEFLGAFSPDGRRLLFTRVQISEDDFSLSVSSIGVDGRGLRRVAEGAVASDWAANGWITYLSLGDLFAVAGPAASSRGLGPTQVVVRAPGLSGRETVLTRETSPIDAVRFAR